MGENIYNLYMFKHIYIYVCVYIYIYIICSKASSKDFYSNTSKDKNYGFWSDM